MFEWKVEDMSLTNDSYVVERKTYYKCESGVSREDKIAFVDSLQNGKLSYLLGLIRKFEEDKESLAKDRYGNVKTVSLKAWIKKNDTKYERPMLDDWYHYGSFKFLGTDRSIQSYGKGRYDTYDDLVDEVFHRQLLECEAQEKRYFLEHDEYSILKTKLRECIDRYNTSFGVNIVISSNAGVSICDGENYHTSREITMEELKEMLAKYKQLDTLIEKLTAETHIAY